MWNTSTLVDDARLENPAEDNSGRSAWARCELGRRPVRTRLQGFRPWQDLTSPAPARSRARLAGGAPNRQEPRTQHRPGTETPFVLSRGRLSSGPLLSARSSRQPGCGRRLFTLGKPVLCQAKTVLFPCIASLPHDPLPRGQSKASCVTGRARSAANTAKYTTLPAPQMPHG